MTNPFFEAPILNSPYEYPARHWELDKHGQPTQKVIESRRRAEFITPIPRPKKQKDKAKQESLVFDEGEGLSTQEQQYAHTAILNGVREHVDKWRRLPNPNDWHVTPETARLLQHWRHHRFNTFRPFFCQVEAVETAIWLSEVAPHAGKAEKAFLEHLENANKDANPELLRLALKLATGASARVCRSGPIIRAAGLSRAGSSIMSGIILRWRRGWFEFTKFPHLSLGIYRERLTVYFTIPNNLRRDIRRYFLDIDYGAFEQKILGVAKKIMNVLPKGAVSQVLLVQRHYPTQSSPPVVDAIVKFNPLMDVPQGDGKGRSVKYQPQWLQATYEILRNRSSNLQFQIGADLPYVNCPVVHTSRVVDVVADMWIWCKPLIAPMLRRA